MDSSSVYWVMQADSIRGALTNSMIGLCILIFALTGAAVILSVENLPTKRLQRAVNACALTIIPLCIALAFVPSTQTLAAMYVLPEIANNPEFKAEAGELYGLAKQALANAAGIEE